MQGAELRADLDVDQPAVLLRPSALQPRDGFIRLAAGSVGLGAVPSAGSIREAIVGENQALGRPGVPD